MHRWSYLRPGTKIAIIAISLALVTALVVFVGFRFTGWFDTESTKITDQGGTLTNRNLTIAFNAGDITKGATVTSRLTDSSRPAPPLALLTYADGPYDIWAENGKLASGKITWSYAKDQYSQDARYLIAGISKEGHWQPLPTQTDPKRQTVSARAYLLPRLALLRVNPAQIGAQLAAATKWVSPDDNPPQAECKEATGRYSLRVQPNVTFSESVPVACSKSKNVYLPRERSRSDSERNHPNSAIDDRYAEPGRKTEMLEIYNPSSFPLIIDLPAGATVTRHNVKTETTAATARSVFGLLLRKLVIPAKGMAEVTVTPGLRNMLFGAQANADTFYTQIAVALLANGLLSEDYATRQQLLNAVDYLAPLGVSDDKAVPFRLEELPQVLTSQRGEVLAQLNLIQPYLSGLGCLGRLSAERQSLKNLQAAKSTPAGTVANEAMSVASSCLGATLDSQPLPTRLLGAVVTATTVHRAVLQRFDEETTAFAAADTVKSTSFSLSAVKQHSLFDRAKLFPEQNPVGWPAAVVVDSEKASLPARQHYLEMLPPTLKIDWPYTGNRGYANDARLKIQNIPVRVRTVYVQEEESFSNNLRSLTTTPVEGRILYFQHREARGGLSLVATFDADPAKQESAAYYALNQNRYVVIEVEKGNVLQLDQALRILLPYLERKLGVTLPY